MPSRTERIVIKLGGSEIVSLPHDWVEGNGLQPGDKVEVLYDQDVLVRLLKRK
ncbi:MAG: AbrB/MazE/SpoVT family DNA-binding domain-containing protein [Candidatus Bathyarchaeia archaeon]